MDKFEEDLREILAQSKHKSSGAERFVRASLAENKYPREFLIYFLNSECFGDYESDNPSYEAWKHQQAKVEELQKRVDAAKQLIEDLNKCYQQDHQNKFEYWRGFADSAGILGKRLEQALKGEKE
ncbi:hypothetical protein ACLDWI_09650 [Acinetobacter baumannii]